MLSPEMIGMSIFGLLVLGGLGLAMRQGAQQRRQLAEFSARHGWSVAEKPSEHLVRLLERLDTDSEWRPRNIMTASGDLHFFTYDVNPKNRPSKSSRGHACLAEYGGRRFDGTVEIFNRTPGVEKLIGDRKDTGSEEFRRAFTVTARDVSVAQMVVNPGIERIMLDHAAGPGWYVTVTIGSGAILVSSFWAESEEEWDYLIALTKRLKEAVR